MNTLLRAAGLLLIPFVLQCPSTGDESTDADANVVKRFAVAKNGAPLVLPVTLNGKTFSFFLDTGATRSCFDTTFPLGEPVGDIEAETPAGFKKLKLYPPPAKVAGLPITNEKTVVGFDLAKLREVTGNDEVGILGMDFLGSLVVQIDFDAGEVSILEKVPKDAGTPVDLLVDEIGYRLCSAWILGVGSAHFIVDSGAGGSFFLNSEGFESAHSSGDLEIVTTSLLESAGGSRTCRVARALNSVSLGGLEVVGPRVYEANNNRLGTGVLSRFRVTFDFPNNKMYLAKGKRFDEPDAWNLSGLSLRRTNGKTFAHFVDKGSVAAVAGIKVGDRITEFDGRNADSVSVFDLRRRLSVPGPLGLAVANDTATTRLNLVLKR